ncbi:hypothetical protein EX30DRAFT_337186 [Ascodesmis nigricans]|uniref:Pre-mRNA-splicing factor RSE1 n=1 Tax=Ascodesmis nigricans TaxID=341454 RepID=A0A4S2N5X2_9PEZI|nr:hypothetical protein EX30DRAFT_337186 [Ascodesmis nigricans]
MSGGSNMFMYSLSIVQPSAVTQAILGSFSGKKQQEIVVAQGSRLCLLRPDASQGKVHEVLTHDVFGIIRSMAAFRLAGSSKDYIIIGTDSGRITILEYQPNLNKFNRLHLETFGKSGSRRVIPGQYLACDPKGRACLIASIEKNKLVYVLNRNAQAELTISSPLEAHRPHCLVFSLVALDVGYENPLFAALEVDYGESDQDPTGQAYEEIEKMLVYYELDLGLNHVVRKWSDPVDRTANMLFQVPGGADGPSGVLVCAEDCIYYRHVGQAAWRVPIPRRKGATEDPNRKRVIVAGVMHKMRGAFFFLLQSEDGDLFKVTLDYEDQGVQRIRIKYFDTVPIATSLCILKSGFLFVASETGNRHFYQFEKLGDDDEETEFNSDDFSSDPLDSYQPIYFIPRPPENLSLVEAIPSMNPLVDCKVVNLTDEDAPQIYTVCGAGGRSTFRILKHGLETTEIVASELPGVPTAVWTTKLTNEDEYDAYIILSFTNGTLVLSIGETVEEVTDTGFLSSAPTLAVQQLGDDGLLQVHPKGIRHIHHDKRVNEWPAPQHRTIVAATTNSRQVAVALSSGEIVYFEMDSDGQLAEYEEKKEMTGTVTCLSLGDVPEGRLRSSFLAVGCDDSTVRILSLEPDSTLESKSVQALTSAPSALQIMSMPDSASETSKSSTLYLHIGLYSGVYLRTVLDTVTGELTDTRTRFLGPKPVKISQVVAQGQPSVLALSSRPWLGYTDHRGQYMLTPLTYAPLEWGWTFSSEQCPEGMVGIQGQNLRIFTIEKLTDNLQQEMIPLTYTPRKFSKHPLFPIFYTIEADANTLSPETKKILWDKTNPNQEMQLHDPQEFGYPRVDGHWASCISVVDPLAKEVLQKIEMTENEAACSIAIAPFTSQDDQHFLCIGTSKNLTFTPRSHDGGFIHVYSFSEDGRSLEFIHKTKTDEPPLALLPFQGRLLAGAGKTLRIYDLGMKQLLRKAQAEVAPNLIMGLQTQGSRIIVSDIQESITYCVYKHADNKIIPFADDTIPRWTTATTMLDYETVAGGDKFGNLWITRCPKKASEESDEDPAGGHLLHERAYLQGTPNRLELMCHFYTQDIPTSIQKAQLVAGGRETIVWSGLQGTVGLMVPFVSREDVDFFRDLEGHMRNEDPPLAGRDHLAYRSYYVPVKGIVDGDLCERFSLLSRDKKQMIAGELDRSVREVERKIADMRSRVAY